MGRKSKNLKFLSRKGAFSLIATYFQSLTLLVPLISILLFNFNLQAILISLLATIWMNFVAAFKTKKMLGFKVSKKALTKIGIYVLALSFLIFYQLYFFGSERIVLASSCPTTAYCPDAYHQCLGECLSTYVSGTTCYYDLDQYCCSISRSDPDTCGLKRDGGPGSCRYAGKCTLACSGVGTSCCPTSSIYRDSVTCDPTAGCTYTDHERDVGGYCEVSGSGCSSAVDFGASFSNWAGSNYPCCGDDGTNDNFAGYNNMPGTDCRRCLNGVDQGTTYICGNGFFSSSSSSCVSADKTTATSGYCFYGDKTCLPNSAQNGAVSPLLYGNGYSTGNKATDKTITCYYGDIGCSDGSYSNGASNTCYGNGYLSGSGTSRTCYYGDITGCSNEVPCYNGASATIYGWGYYTGNPSTDQTGTCYYGPGSCSDGSYSNGASTTVYGNGYWTSNTCYYGDWSCSDGSYSHGASGTTLCSAGNSQCCPNQGQRVEGVQCGDNVFNAGTAYDRDSSQARCEDGSSPGCSAKTWLVSNSTPGGPCCGDDGTNDFFENSGSGNSACVQGEKVSHDRISSTNTSYLVFNGELFYCKEVGGPNSEYSFVTSVNPGAAIGSWKCAYGVWSSGVRVGLRGGRIIIIP
ncbi:MAG: hypothetical protein QXL86_03900 [Candidatus Aenigmatarchaeota archaeon]